MTNRPSWKARIRVLTPVLMRAILGGYQLPAMGIHGLPHWARVLETGLRLAEITEADPDVVALFAVLHDSRRINEGTDPGHGLRGAGLAGTLRGGVLKVSDEAFDLVFQACEHHTDGLLDGNITLQTYWDSDRLDLSRVGIDPSPKRLCTKAARDRHFMRWAIDRSAEGFVPEIVTRKWLG